MNDYWLTTGETAKKLGVSRQHVVDLCNRNELSFVKVGTHRRILDSSARALIKPPLTREQENRSGCTAHFWRTSCLTRKRS